MNSIHQRNVVKCFVINFVIFIYVISSTEADLYEGSVCQLQDGSLALCKRLETCRWALEGVNSGQFTYSNIKQCGFVRNSPIVCCADERPSSSRATPRTPPNTGGDNDNIIFITTTRSPRGGSTTKRTNSATRRPNTPPSRVGGRKAEQACVNYAARALTNNNNRLSFHILGGTEAELGEFPHMAALGYQSIEGIQYNCGGSLISEQWILTAAHCVSSRDRPSVVRLGKTSIATDDDGAVPLDRDIAEIIRHPKYNGGTKKNDIALIRLSNPVPLSDPNIRPACLRTVAQDLPTNHQVFLTGWGATLAERRNVGSGVLLKTNVTSLPLKQCNETLLEFNRRADQASLRSGIDNGQLCTHDPHARNDACAGDSGGPVQITEVNGISTIIGVTSFGVSCGSTLPSISTRVAYYIDWIESIVWPDS